MINPFFLGFRNIGFQGFVFITPKEDVIAICFFQCVRHFSLPFPLRIREYACTPILFNYPTFIVLSPTIFRQYPPVVLYGYSSISDPLRIPLSDQGSVLWTISADTTHLPKVPLPFIFSFLLASKCLLFIVKTRFYGFLKHISPDSDFKPEIIVPSSTGLE